jgi:hypothetical protein
MAIQGILSQGARCFNKSTLRNARTTEGARNEVGYMFELSAR